MTLIGEFQRDRLMKKRELQGVIRNRSSSVGNDVTQLMITLEATIVANTENHMSLESTANPGLETKEGVTTTSTNLRMEATLSTARGNRMRGLSQNQKIRK